MTREGNKLTADEGMIFVDKDNSWCGTTIWLSPIDSADNYREITDAEWAVIEEEQRMKEEMGL